MNKAKIALAVAALGVTLAAMPANAGIVIDVVPCLAPNVFGSPSFPGAEANAVQGMMNGGIATVLARRRLLPNPI